VVKISYNFSLYLLRYDLWKLQFLNASKISFKEVSLEFLYNLFSRVFQTMEF
jgi:hypothetical protein